MTNDNKTHVFALVFFFIHTSEFMCIIVLFHFSFFISLLHLMRIMIGLALNIPCVRMVCTIQFTFLIVIFLPTVSLVAKT